jgi:hypothetical protein
VGIAAGRLRIRVAPQRHLFARVIDLLQLQPEAVDLRLCAQRQRQLRPARGNGKTELCGHFGGHLFHSDLWLRREGRGNEGLRGTERFFVNHKTILFRIKNEKLKIKN